MNGGSGNTPGSVIATYNSAMPKLSVSTPTRSGYTFKGWYDNSNYTIGHIFYNTDGSSARPYDKTSNTTLYAGWALNQDGTYTITFDLNGGSGTKPSNISVKYNAALSKITTAAPQYSGYIFMGWFDNKNFKQGIQYYSADGNSTRNYNVKANTTLYAGWMSTDTFIVKYDCNGGSGAPAIQYVKNNDIFVPAANTCKKSGYVFDGWYDTSNNDWTLNAILKASFKNGSNGISNNTFVLKAAWDKELPTNMTAFKPTSVVDHNGKTVKITYAGECDNSKINKKTNTINMGSGQYCSFESPTLKYYMVKGKGSEYLFTFVWVQDAYNQLRVAIAETDPNPPQEKISDNRNNTLILKEQLARDILTHEINTYGYANKGLVGVNASAMIGQKWALGAPKGWRGGPQINVFRNKGKTIRSGYSYFQGDIQYGLAKDGHLKSYNPKGDSNTNVGQRNALIKNYIENVDEVKDVYGFLPVLVKKGKSLKDIDSRMSWTDYSHARQAICQIDKNNFLLITSIRNPDKDSKARGLSLEEVANMMITFNCYTGFNFDGGGSTSYFYKGKSSVLSGPMHAHDGRISGDVLYFVEK